MPNANAAYPNTDTTPPAAIGNIVYNTIAFQADNEMAISSMAFNIAVEAVFDGGLSLSQSFYCLRLTTTPTLQFFNVPTPTAAIPQPTTPGNIGNDIYSWSAAITQPSNAALITTASFQNYNYQYRYEPYDLIFKFNQIFYLHLGVDTATAASNLGEWFTTVTFYTLPTGAKS